MLYHEKQVHTDQRRGPRPTSPLTTADPVQVAALCGVHCINTLLQGPYFSELDLAQVCCPASANTDQQVCMHACVSKPNP